MKRKAFAQIPLMIGLLIMAIAVPVATKLVQTNQENRGKAMGDECTTNADCGTGYHCTAGLCVKNGPTATTKPTATTAPKSPTATTAPKSPTSSCAFGSCTVKNSTAKCVSGYYFTCDGKCWTNKTICASGSCASSTACSTVSPTATPAAIGTCSATNNLNEWACDGSILKQCTKVMVGSGDTYLWKMISDCVYSNLCNASQRKCEPISQKICRVGSCVTQFGSTACVRQDVSVDVYKDCPNDNCTSCGGGNGVAPTKSPESPTATPIPQKICNVGSCVTQFGSSVCIRSPQSVDYNKACPNDSCTSCGGGNGVAPTTALTPTVTPTSTTCSVTTNKPNGCNCSSNSVCKSGYCDGISGYCKTAPTATPTKTTSCVASTCNSDCLKKASSSNPYTYGVCINNSCICYTGATPTPHGGCTIGTCCANGHTCIAVSNYTNACGGIVCAPTQSPTQSPTNSPINPINPTATPTLKVTAVPTNKTCNPFSRTKATLNDFSIWRSEYIEGSYGSITRSTWQADFDCNNKVTLNDYSIWRTNYIKSL